MLREQDNGSRTLPISARPRASDRAFTGAFALIVSAVACAIVAIAAPRPVAPTQLPALRLARADVEAQLADDRARAAHAPSGPEVDAFLALYLEEGRAELEPIGNYERLSERRAALAAAARSVFARHGRARTRALLAHLTERAIDALRGKLADTHEARGLLGAFPRLLVRYGYATESGALLAPELSIRGFYKARFNLICERPRERDLTAIERQAYEGWNALHAGEMAPELRALAARAYREAGGAYGAEAHAIWMYQAGESADAVALFLREYERTGQLRLRNLGLFTKHTSL